MSTSVTTKAIAKVAAVATGLAMATSMLSLAPYAHAAALTDAQVQSILSLLTSFGADASTIANVQASLTGGTPVSTGTGSTTTSACSFTRDLTVGSKGDDVTCLQNVLAAKGYLAVAATGYFGSLTQAAVAKWQAAAGVTPAAGYFGAKSRAAFTGMGSGSTGSTGGTTTPVTGNGLKVMLAPTSPSGSVLVQGQGIGNLADFTFSNPTSAPIAVTALTFNRIGVSNDETISNVYLYNGVNRITDSAGVSASQFSFTNASGLFTVAAGGTYTVSVRADIAGSTNGQQIGVKLVSASSSGTLDSSVVFPIMGGYQTISAASLATVSFNTSTTPSATTISPQSSFAIWQNTVTVSTNAVKLSSMKFTNLGSIDSMYLTNLRLYVDGTQVGSTVAAMGADRTVSFDLSASPVSLTQAGHVIKVLADITGGASRTVQFSIQRSSDAMMIDSQLNQPVTPTVGSSSFTAVSAGIVTIQSVSATSGVSVTRSAGSPNQNVAVGQTNVKWASFDFLASGENTKVMDLYVIADTSVHNGGLDNGKVYVNGLQVGSTKDLNNGATGAASSAATDFSLGSSLVLPAGQLTVVDIYADAKTSTSTNLSNNETVIIYLIAGSSNAQGQSSLNSANVPASETSGNTITVSSSTLTGTKYSGYGAQTMIAGASNARIGAFTLSTGSTEGVTVNTIGISLAGNNSASITNLTLKDNSTGTTLGTVITTPSSSNSFAVNLPIAKSSTKTIDVYANILSGIPAGTIVASIASGTTGVGETTGTSADIASAPIALQTITVGSGLLTATRGAGDPVSNNILSGAASVKVGQFNLAAQNSPFTVQDLAILVPNNAATSVTDVTVSYKDANGATQTSTRALTTSASTAYATATFTGLSFYVPKDDSANLDVYVGTPTSAAGATPGAAVQVTLDAGATSGTFRAINSAGSATTTFNGGTNLASNGTFYVRDSIPTVAVLSAANQSVPSNVLYQFSITADPAGAIEWTKVKFTVATTSATITNVDLVDNATGTSLLDSSTTSATTTSTAITVDLAQNATQAAFQQIAAGATKTYNLVGTVSGFTTGSTITIRLAQDTLTTTNASAATVAAVPSNFVWSDRSASAHTVSTSDWTNGYLVKNFTTNTVTYSK